MILYGEQVFYEIALLKIIHPVLGVCLEQGCDDSVSYRLLPFSCFNDQSKVTDLTIP